MAKAKSEKLGTNVRGVIEGKKLIITIDLSKDFGLSKSGKTVTIATTHGFVKVNNGAAMISINCNRYPVDDED